MERTKIQKNSKSYARARKLGAQRTIQLKQQTAELLGCYVDKRRISSPNQKLFGSARKIKETWRKYRKKAYEKFKDAELLKIRLYDLRHWFATTTYLKTRDIFFVKYLLGHRRIENTMTYVHLAKGMMTISEDYVCRAAETVAEASKLIESGFEYVTDVNGAKLFRKRKYPLFIFPFFWSHEISVGRTYSASARYFRCRGFILPSAVRSTT